MGEQFSIDDVLSNDSPFYEGGEETPAAVEEVEPPKAEAKPEKAPKATTKAVAETGEDPEETAEEEEAAEAEEPAEKEPEDKKRYSKASKHKVKWGDGEREVTLQDLMDNYRPGDFSHRVTIDGEEVEVTQKDLTPGYRHHSAAERRFQEAAKLAEEWQEDREVILKNPQFYFRAAGIDGDKWAMQRARELMSYEELGPEDRAQAVIRQYESEKAQEEGTRRQQMQQKQASETRTRIIQQYQREIPAELEKVGLAGDVEIERRVAGHIALAARNGYQMSTEDAVSRAAEEFRTSTATVLGKMSGEQLLKFLGPDAVKALRKADVKAVKSEPIERPAATPLSRPNGKRGFMSVNEFMEGE